LSEAHLMINKKIEETKHKFEQFCSVAMNDFSQVSSRMDVSFRDAVGDANKRFEDQVSVKISTASRQIETLQGMYEEANENFIKTGEGIEKAVKEATEEFKKSYEPTVTVLKKIRIETWKLKKPVWLVAVFTMFLVSLLPAGMLGYYLFNERTQAQMWRQKAEVINHYLVDRFYSVLDEKDRQAVDHYYKTNEIVSPQEQIEALKKADVFTFPHK